MAMYDKKDSVNTCKTLFTGVRTCKHWKNEKMQVFTPELWHLCVLFLVGYEFNTCSFISSFDLTKITINKCK